MKFLLTFIRCVALFVIFYHTKPDASELLVALALLVVMGICYFEGLNKL